MNIRKEYDSKTLAAQLRRPEGELGIKVGENMNKGNRLMNLETIRLLEIAENDNILEIGMGNGFFVRDVVTSATNVSYTGCDFSETMVKEANDLNHSISKAKFILSDANKLPFGDNMFDKVFTVNTIYFWQQAPQVLAEIKRVLKPKGLFIVALRPKHVMDQLPVVEHGFITYTQREVADLVTGNNFDVVSVAENEDIDIKLDERNIKNAFVIIKTIKK